MEPTVECALIMTEPALPDSPLLPYEELVEPLFVVIAPTVELAMEADPPSADCGVP